MEDIGVSAFRGLNIKEGALGVFLNAVRAGKVQKGAYLLVESLDRISRQEVVKSLAVFLELINSGIKIVTLADSRLYSAENLELGELFYSLSDMSRGYGESFLKSKRVSAAWANKRASANIRPLTKWCPGWLRLSGDRKKYVEIPDRVAIVRSIFEDAVAGMGVYVITRRLNEKKVPHFGKSNGWHVSYVSKILSNRATIGEYQPCRLLPGKRREPVGEVVHDYFPRIIDDSLFYRAQQARHERRTNSGGRKGEYLTNLFSGIARCAYCNGRIKLERKGPLPKGNSYLVCEGSKRGLGCTRSGWRYEQFEASFLAFVRQLNLAGLIRDDDSKQKRIDLEIQAIEGERHAIKQEMDNVYALLNHRPDLKYVADKLSELELRLQRLEGQLSEKQNELRALKLTGESFYESKEELRSLIANLQIPDQEHGDLYRLRSQLSARIKALVDALHLAPAGYLETSKQIKFEDMDLNTAFAHVMKIGKDQRYFLVRFTNGDLLGVQPKQHDPLQFDLKAVSAGANGAEITIHDASGNLD